MFPLLLRYDKLILLTAVHPSNLRYNIVYFMLLLNVITINLAVPIDMLIIW